MFVDMDDTLRALLFGGLFLVALAAVLWTVYDAQARGRTTGWSIVWWVAGGTGTMLVLPALIINAFQLDTSEQDLIDPLSYLGIVGVVLALLCTAGYFVTTAGDYRGGTETIEIQPEPDSSFLRTEPIVLEDDYQEPKTMVMRRPTSRLASFWIASGPRRNTQFPLAEITNIGRSGQTNEIILADESVSGEHARVRFDAERKAFVFRDLDSTNGSWLVTPEGRAKIEAPHVLKDGDLIEVGSTTLVFKEVADAPSS